MATAEKTQYDAFAQLYDSLASLPLGQLENKLMLTALQKSTDLTFLDIGGGSGLNARRAVDAGAKFVDLIDISPEMLNFGKATEEKLGREGKIRWHVGDATESFDSLPLEPEGYDVVMMNWTFDHASTLEELNAMWANVSRHCKPGGRLINIRVRSPLAPAAKSGSIGLRLTDHQEIPGPGVRYMVNYATTPPFSHEGTSLEESYSLSNTLNHRYGFGDLQVIPAADTEVVRSDPEKWQEFLQEPFWVVLTASKNE